MSEAKHTPGPWGLCAHLQSIEKDQGCRCGYRGVIYGPDGYFAICQPGHDADEPGQEGLGPRRYDRETEIANAHLIAAAPDMLEALKMVLQHGRIDDSESRMNMVAAAIVKAEGR